MKFTELRAYSVISNNNNKIQVVLIGTMDKGEMIHGSLKLNRPEVSLSVSDTPLSTAFA